MNPPYEAEQWPRSLQLPLVENGPPNSKPQWLSAQLKTDAPAPDKVKLPLS